MSIHYHAEHCGLHVNLTLDPDTKKPDAEFPASVATTCLICEEDLTAVLITRWEHERYTAIEDECKNCGQEIVFLPDHLAWVHAEDEAVSILAPDYGLQTCEAAMVRLLNLPAVSLPEYAGKQAEPADTHVTVNLKTGDTETASERASALDVNP